MGKGYIQVHLFTANESKPLTNAHIRINQKMDGKNDLDDVFLVNQSGKSEKFEVDAPEKRLSLDKNSTEVPYSLYDILITAVGYEKTVITGIQVFESITSLQKVEMIPLAKGVSLENTLNIINITPHKLVLDSKDYRKISPKETNYLLQQAFIPEFIVVHLGKPCDNSENVTVSFREYIKNVASNEIYPTWTEAAIRANIYAQISFALNRIYTEWYTCRGYNFMITGSPIYDQYFVKGRNIFENINTIVDDIFNKYIKKIGYNEPLFATFCNGTTVTYKGLSQWESLELSENGYTDFGILQNYYGSDIELVRTNNVNGIYEVYQGEIIKYGSKGEAVKIIQRQLNRVSRNYTSINKILSVDGKFNESTEKAVKEFQTIFNLKVDGEVGRSTWYTLAYIYISAIRSSESFNEADYCDFKESKYPGFNIQVGSKGEVVKELQCYLSLIAKHYENIPKVNIDGIFGNKTKGAIVAFQKAFKLNEDGIVNIITWNKLYQVQRTIKEAFKNPLYYNSPNYPGYPLIIGMRGEEIERIQYYLNIIGNVYSCVQKITVDGIFGNQTRSSVLSFQLGFRLEATGTVDIDTWNKIYEVYSKLDSNRNMDKPKDVYEYPGSVIKFGDCNGLVKLIQKYINIINHNSDEKSILIDGVFGPKTESKIKDIQKHKGYKDDGIVEENTWNLLTKCYIDIGQGPKAPKSLSNILNEDSVKKNENCKIKKQQNKKHKSKKKSKSCKS